MLVVFSWRPFTQHPSHDLATPTLDADISLTNQNIENSRYAWHAWNIIIIIVVNITTFSLITPIIVLLL